MRRPAFAFNEVEGRIKIKIMIKIKIKMKGGTVLDLRAADAPKSNTSRAFPGRLLHQQFEMSYCRVTEVR
jgi:hypothetical protein